MNPTEANQQVIGAICDKVRSVGVGSDLLDMKAIEAGQYDVLTEQANRMVENLVKARSSLAT